MIGGRLAVWTMVARGTRMIEYRHCHSLHYSAESYWGGILAHSLEAGRTYEELSVIAGELQQTDATTESLRLRSDAAVRRQPLGHGVHGTAPGWRLFLVRRPAVLRPDRRLPPPPCSWTHQTPLTGADQALSLSRDLIRRTGPVRILDGLPLTDMRPDWRSTLAPRGLSVPGELYLCYAEEGGPLVITEPENVPLPYRVVDPRTGATVREGVRATAGDPVPDEGGAPRVYICHDPGRSRRILG